MDPMMLEKLIQMLTGGGGVGMSQVPQNLTGQQQLPSLQMLSNPPPVPQGPMPQGPGESVQKGIRLPDGQMLRPGDSMAPSGFVRPGGVHHFAKANPHRLPVVRGSELEQSNVPGTGGTKPPPKKRSTMPSTKGQPQTSRGKKVEQANFPGEGGTKKSRKFSSPSTKKQPKPKKGKTNSSKEDLAEQMRKDSDD